MYPAMAMSATYICDAAFHAVKLIGVDGLSAAVTGLNAAARRIGGLRRDVHRCSDYFVVAPLTGVTFVKTGFVLSTVTERVNTACMFPAASYALNCSVCAPVDGGRGGPCVSKRRDGVCADDR